MFEYHADSNNEVAGPLNQRPDLVEVGGIVTLSTSRASTVVKNQIKQLSAGDPVAKQLWKLVKIDSTWRFWVEDGLLLTKRSRLYVLKGGNLRKTLIAKCHDTECAGLAVSKLWHYYK